MEEIHLSWESMHCKRTTCILYAVSEFNIDGLLQRGRGNGISSDGADRSWIFLSLKFSIRGFLVVGKFYLLFFFFGGGGSLI